MNETMKVTWLEISEMLGEPTPEELSVFLRTWQRAIQAEREECAKLCDELSDKHGFEGCYANECAAAIRARGQA
jgi:hypothetical protein